MVIGEREAAVKAAARAAASDIAFTNSLRNMQTATSAAAATAEDVLDDDEIAFNEAFRDMLNASP
jgi:hypothetical protein